ncbi:MAG: hypothetical protein IJG60_03890, partial [Thermoguttaceae bacterium]|nr:hypothetical protein [Thermoguttaceae bacterium]
SLSSFTGWKTAVSCLEYDTDLPLFAGAEVGDYRLAEKSQAINAGNNDYVTTEVDLAGNARIADGVVDLGAYEYQVKTSTIVVTTSEDIVDETDGFVSLREAISYAETADIIIFDDSLAGKTIILNGNQLETTKAITIDATDIDGITIDANSQSRVFSVNGGTSDVPVILIGLTMTGGEAEDGGGIYIDSGETNVIGCTIVGNSSNRGGGIYNHNGALILADSTVSNNRASNGGGIFSETGDLVMTNSIIADNLADGGYGTGGGGIYKESGTLTITDGTVSNNQANIGGGIFSETGGLAITNSVITDNFTDGSYGGGGIYKGSGTLTLTGSTVSNNRASNGGGIFSEADDLVIINSVIADNFARGISGGGGIYKESGTLDITGSTISGNTASDHSGATGGGIHNTFGTLTLTNSTVTGNTANFCGGIYNGGDGVLTLTDSTVAGNTANYTAGGIGNYSTLKLYNSIVVQNVVSFPGNHIIDIYSPTNTSIAGIVYAYNTLSSFTEWTESEYCLAYDPSLPLFTDPENDDYTLAENSQAIDKGNNNYVTTETDLAGSPRIVSGIVDLGAYEYQAGGSPAEQLAAPVITTGDKGVFVSYGANRHQITWDAVEHASGYELAYSVDGNSWTTVSATETSKVFTGLTYGADMQYRVRALGDGVSYTDSDWSTVKVFNVCPMDIDGNGDIAGGDRVLMISAWLSGEGDDEFLYAADINADGDIGRADRTYLVNNWLGSAEDDDLVYPPAKASDAVFAEFASADLDTDLNAF